MRVSQLPSVLLAGTYATVFARESSQTSWQAVTDDIRLQHAKYLLIQSPLLDTHVDTPQVMRVLAERPMDMIPQLGSGMSGHFDIPRAKEGGVGGVFFTVWTPCQDQLGVDVGADYLKPDNTVRDTYESIDLIRNMIEAHNDSLYPATNAQGIRTAFSEGKIAALIGMEGSHMLGGSLSTIRTLAALGVRYLTLTHVCYSPFASSAGGGAGTDGSFIPPSSLSPTNGLTPIGVELVKELNRLGVMVDLSHTSDATMAEALDVSEAPVIFSHSGARAIHHHPRNVPDQILDRMGPGKNEGIILSVLYNHFIDPNNATIARVADHVEYIASKTSKKHVGLSSDFDGMSEVVEGLEDTSKWPYLVAEFIRRGWTDEEVLDLTGRNLLRVMEEVEQVAQELKIERQASPAIYDKRTDLPGTNWGGPKGAYLPPAVKQIVDRRTRIVDEL
ncbi:uncharacterized protein I303_104031 [Kwoniella dejecticola CBS 10117]|uniref:Dipeptidase n=1 Tax=Kwoniella dejecticola CBS 10117 TaxID=1296121 RepID=A0A1A6A8E5_9TREE|nr:uncharacterized protein I303_04050 [Kwoniella dejecticola CBS 10117]OBR86326.1 hypothetical protein I303_04050 [Kwoniella dejecticola CBS 10117]